MSTLKHTLRDPSEFTDPVFQQEVIEGGIDEEIDTLRKRLHLWEIRKTTRDHQITSELADPIIEHLETILRKSVLEFEGLTPDQITMLKAEVTGELRAWRTLKYAPDLLKHRLNSLVEALGKQEQGRKEKYKLWEKYT